MVETKPKRSNLYIEITSANITLNLDFDVKIYVFRNNVFKLPCKQTETAHLCITYIPLEIALTNITLETNRNSPIYISHIWPVENKHHIYTCMLRKNVIE